MTPFALYVRLEAKPGKEQEVAAFLASAHALALEEAGTVCWFAIRSGRSTFAIFDAFSSEDGRDAHLNGKIASALMARAPELFSNHLEVVKLEVIADKLPG